LSPLAGVNVSTSGRALGVNVERIHRRARDHEEPVAIGAAVDHIVDVDDARQDAGLDDVELRFVGAGGAYLAK
jgi:hypothetical protein